MFNDIGKKIKGLAKLICWLCAIPSIISDIVFMTMGDMFVLIGLLVAAVGILLAWIGSVALYGFGELIDKTVGIYRLLGGKEDMPVSQGSFAPEAIAQEGEHKDHWFCPKCGRKYEFWVKKCVNCGADRPEN